MKEEFSELARHLDDKFEALKRLFLDLQDKISNMERKIDDLQRNKTDKTDLHNIANTLNDYARKAETHFQEATKTAYKIDECERQISQLSSRIK